MIVRTWMGWTTTERTAEYEEYMHEAALGGYAEVPGNLGVLMLKRPASNDRTEFLMISLWDSMDSVRAFAGDAPSTAVFYPRDHELLSERELEVKHYEVYGATPKLGEPAT